CQNPPKPGFSHRGKTPPTERPSDALPVCGFPCRWQFPTTGFSCRESRPGSCHPAKKRLSRRNHHVANGAKGRVLAMDQPCWLLVASHCRTTDPRWQESVQPATTSRHVVGSSTTSISKNQVAPFSFYFYVQKRHVEAQASMLRMLFRISAVTVTLRSPN